jgi:hypothetical protein
MFCLFVIVVILIYLYYVNVVKNPPLRPMVNPYGQSTLGTTVSNPTVIMVSEPPVLPPSLIPVISNAANPVVGSLDNPYIPPVNNTDVLFPMNGPSQRGLPVNMRSRGEPGGYSPIGILTRTSGSGDMVLPLMGRQAASGRGQYQYYTMMTSGSINPKLPVSVNGKSCTSEYGCNEINNGDMVYVDGINDTFRATIYENTLFTYIPY